MVLLRTNRKDYYIISDSKKLDPKPAMKKEEEEIELHEEDLEDAELTAMRTIGKAKPT